MMGISVVPLGTALVLVLGAAMLASTGLAQMLLITLNSDYNGAFFHFRILSPSSYVFKAMYAEDNWGARFRGVDIIKEFVNIRGEKACKPLSKQQKAKVKGRVFLVERGECTFFIKGQNCQEAGAYACLIFDKDENEDTKDVEMFISMPAADEDIEEAGRVDIPVGYIRRQDGLYIRQLIHEETVTSIQLNLNSSSFSIQDQPTWSLW